MSEFWEDIKYFKPEEFECKCGCNKQNMEEQFIRRLDIARMNSTIPFTINSGCRCAKHNAKIGGIKTSSHLYGWAADIKTATSSERYEILAALLDAGFRRIGIGKNFLHVDDDEDKPADVAWVYKK
jgi:zinc D-Ala-D-Ala carboxypeptidase